MGCPFRQSNRLRPDPRGLLWGRFLPDLAGHSFGGGPFFFLGRTKRSAKVECVTSCWRCFTVALCTSQAFGSRGPLSATYGDPIACRLGSSAVTECAPRYQPVRRSRMEDSLRSGSLSRLGREEDWDCACVCCSLIGTAGASQLDQPLNKARCEPDVRHLRGRW
nr:hypothetical protein BDOA9_0202500 [Bradyrhizobium sp. DOA9]